MNIMKFNIQSREKYTVNTDPQRRCYNGCNFFEEVKWSDWRHLNSTKTREEAIESVKLWQSIPMGQRKVEFRYKENHGI